MHMYIKMILSAFFLITAVGCDIDWENGGYGGNPNGGSWGNQEPQGMGFEMELQFHGATTGLEIDCEMRSSSQTGSAWVPCDGIQSYTTGNDIWVVYVPNVPPDATLQFEAQVLQVGDEDAVFCRNDPEADLWGWYNGFALDMDNRQSDCELRLRMDDLLR